MKRIINQLAFAVVLTAVMVPLLMPLHPAYASNTTQAAYKATVGVNASSSYYNQTANFTLSTATLQAQNYLNPSCNNSAVLSDTGADVPYMPASGSNNQWTLWVDSITSMVYKNYYLYTGGTINMDAKLRYFPGNAGMITPDAADIEPANNYSISVRGYIDTSTLGDTNNAIIKKDDAFKVEKSVVSTGVINAILYSDLESKAGTHSVYLIPTGNGSTIENSPNSGDNYQCVDDPVGAPDEHGSYVYTTSASYKTDFYTTTLSDSIPTAATINYVKVYYRVLDTSYAVVYYQPKLYLGGNTQVGTEYIDGTSDTYNTHSENITKPGGGTWGISDISSLQIGIQQKRISGSDLACCTQLYAEVNYTYTPISLSISGVSSGEHTVTLSCNTTNTVLSVDYVNIYNTSTDTDYWPFGWHQSNIAKAAQTFTLPTEGIITATSLYLAHGTVPPQYPSVLYAEIQTTSSGIPSGTVLCSGSMATSSITDSLSWYTIPMGSQVLLDANTLYSLVVYTNTDADGLFIWGSSGNTYSNGTPMIWETPDFYWDSLDTPEDFNFILSGNLSATTSAFTVYNSSNDWTTGYKNAMPYIHYQSLSVNGTQKQLVKWTDSNTFTDLTGNGHNTTPSFALAPNITATITSFEPINASVSTYTSVNETANLVSGVAAPASNYASENMSPGIIGADVLNTFMDAGQIPRSLVWFIIAFGCAIGAGFFVYRIVSKGARHTSSALLTQAIVSGVILSIFSVGSNNVVPWYCVIIFAIEALGIIMAQKQTGW